MTIEEVAKRVGATVSPQFGTCMMACSKCGDPRGVQLRCEQDSVVIDTACGCPPDAQRPKLAMWLPGAELLTAREARKRGRANGNADHEARREPTVVLREASSYKIKSIDWLWPGWIARGKLHVLAGKPGIAKTTLMLEFAAIVSRRGQWPDDTTAPPGDVLIWSGEDDPEDTLVPRLIAAGADLSRVRIISATADGKGLRPFNPASDMAQLAEAIRHKSPAFVGIDPMVAAITGDSHKSAEVRAGLQPFVDLAASAHFAGLGVHHFAKNTQGREPIDRLIGSIGFGAAPRIVLAAVAAAEAGAPFRLVRAKSNIGPTGGGFEYQLLQQFAVAGEERVAAQSIEWGQALDGAPRTLLAVEEIDQQRQPREEAAEFLRELLSQGARPIREIEDAAKANGHGWRTIERAKRDLGVKAAKLGLQGGWTWEMPAIPEGRHEW